MGTMEMLFSKPLSDWDIVIGKFLASFALTLVALLPTLIYYCSIYRLGNPPGNVDTAGVIGSYIGLSLLAFAFCAVGILASSLTVNQIVSFILAAFFCFILYSGFESLASLAGNAALLTKQVGMLYHYDALSKGLIDSRDVIYFLSIGGVMLLGAKVALGSRHW